jgi:multiple sugar transport system permease protein
MAAIIESLSKWRARRADRLARGKPSGLSRRETRLGLLFLSPWIIGLLAFYLIPMGASLVFSFTKFQLGTGAATEGLRFVGFNNYLQLFRDPQVRKALSITLRFMLFALPVGVAWPVLLALMLNAKNLWAKQLFRTLYYLPYIVPVVSVAYIWQGFLNTRTGWLNRFLETLSIPGPEWLNSTTWIYPALILVGLWGVGDALIRTLAGLQNVPKEFYEAARVDGAGWFRMFWGITVPMVSPMIFYNALLLVIGLFQYFTLAWILGGPNSNPSEATLFYNVYLYKQAFVYSNMGYGSTLAWVLFLLALVVTIVLFGTQKYWVYYAAEEG